MLHFPSPHIGMFGRRQRHARGHRIAVSIVARNDASPQDPDTIMVADEFGANDIVSRTGACTCCTVRGKLRATLLRLLMERERRHFGRVVIGTNEDPGPILRTFAAEQVLGAEFYVEDAPPLAGTRFELAEQAPLSWEAFSRFITTLQALRGADLLQAKGLLNVAGCRGPVAVQFLGHLAHAPVELQAWPDERRHNRLEFITRNIGESEVRSLFDSIRALSTSS